MPCAELLQSSLSIHLLQGVARRLLPIGSDRWSRSRQGRPNSTRCPLSSSQGQSSPWRWRSRRSHSWFAPASERQFFHQALPDCATTPLPGVAPRSASCVAHLCALAVSWASRASNKTAFSQALRMINQLRSASFDSWSAWLNQVPLLCLEDGAGLAAQMLKGVKEIAWFHVYSLMNLGSKLFLWEILLSQAKWNILDGYWFFRSRLDSWKVRLNGPIHRFAFSCVGVLS